MSLVASIVPIGPVRSAAMACAASSMLGSAVAPAPPVAKFCLDERRVTGLEEVHGPRHGVGPEAVHVLALRTDDGARLGEQRLGVAVGALGEEIGQDAHHVVAELALVAVHTGVEVVCRCG